LERAKHQDIQNCLFNQFSTSMMALIWVKHINIFSEYFLL